MAISHGQANKPFPSIRQLVEACREGRVEEIRDILGPGGGSELRWVPFGESRLTPLVGRSRGPT